MKHYIADPNQNKILFEAEPMDLDINHSVDIESFGNYLISLASAEDQKLAIAHFADLDEIRAAYFEDPERTSYSSKIASEFLEKELRYAAKCLNLNYGTT